MNQFSEKFYIHVRQSYGATIREFTIQRLNARDTHAELTADDLRQADYRAAVNPDFQAGYYDVELRDWNNHAVIDSEHCIL